MYKILVLIVLLNTLNLSAQEKPIKILEENQPNRIAFYAINETETDYDVILNISGTNFRQSAAKPRFIRVPATSKVHLKSIILNRGKTPKYTYQLIVNDSLSKRALKKPAVKIIVPPKKIKPNKYIIVYNTVNCIGCEAIIDSLNTNNYIFNSFNLAEKPELQLQLSKSFASSSPSLDSITKPIVNLGGKLYNWIENYEQLMAELNPKSAEPYIKSTVVLNSFSVIGMKVRTRNANGQAKKDIDSLWHKFKADTLVNALPNVNNKKTYVIYTNYGSDHLDWYDTIIGYKTTKLDEVPEGLIGHTVLTDTYNLLKPRDQKATTSMDTWSYIWKNISNRAYNSDFDVYEFNPDQPEDIIISTYVSIK